MRAKLSSEHGKTQLGQGYLAHPRQDGKATPRGDGFELRIDRHSAIRAGHSLLLSTEVQNGAGSKQLARDGAQSKLDAALALAQSLVDTASAQLADTLEAVLDATPAIVAYLVAHGASLDDTDKYGHKAINYTDKLPAKRQAAIRAALKKL